MQATRGPVTGGILLRYTKGMDRNDHAPTGEPDDKKPLRILPVVLDVGFTIAIPLVALALGGRLLDKHLGSSPLFLLTGMLLAITISTVIVYKKISKLL